MQGMTAAHLEQVHHKRTLLVPSHHSVTRPEVDSCESEEARPTRITRITHALGQLLYEKAKRRISLLQAHVIFDSVKCDKKQHDTNYR